MGFFARVVRALKNYSRNAGQLEFRGATVQPICINQSDSLEKVVCSKGRAQAHRKGSALLETALRNYDNSIEELREMAPNTIYNKVKKSKDVVNFVRQRYLTRTIEHALANLKYKVTENAVNGILEMCYNGQREMVPQNTKDEKLRNVIQEVRRIYQDRRGETFNKIAQSMSQIEVPYGEKYVILRESDVREIMLRDKLSAVK